jgi:beta-galactosidase/beta-glucuronidase
MPTRRRFIAESLGAAAVLAASQSAATDTKSLSCITEVVGLCGEWQLRTDPNNTGVKENWFATKDAREGWRKVTVPHTWQIESGLTDYRGVAWYFRSFDARSSWRESAVRVEFEAVFHSAQVWVNGTLVGEHARKGYTAFTLDITHALQWGGPNTIAVRVDNAFNDHMVPRGRSSDWANDGGIFRPVQLLITSKTFVERVDVEAEPDLASGGGKLTINAYVRNASADLWKGKVAFRVTEGDDSPAVLTHSPNEMASVNANSVEKLPFTVTLPKAKLWHFDHPHLYELEFSISNERDAHFSKTSFGVRNLEVREGGFYLNGERVRLMGVERMAGSNPEFGMAEPTEWIDHDHADMKNLNCVFTRVHWPQDRRVLDYCDRHGILMQTEVPAWGPDTFAGMVSEPDDAVMQNALEQLREMVARDRNHPSVVVWGLCNEIGGQNPPAFKFAKRLLEEAKRLDPGRLCSYASNSLSETPERDVSQLMDFVEANEYFGTWAPGTAEDAGHYLDKIHAAFPNKPVVISEYGYCACTPDRPEGDQPRVEILRSHDEVIRARDFVGGAIFFCYNDYRTHIGDRGLGALQQRVHGVVDVYGARKPSYEVLRRESSPIETLTVQRRGNEFEVLIRTRRDFPAHTLRGYKLRGLFFGQGEIPVERQEVVLPDLSPGSDTKCVLTFGEAEVPVQIQFEVLRPTSFSAHSVVWKP